MQSTHSIYICTIGFDNLFLFNMLFNIWKHQESQVAQIKLPFKKPHGEED